MTFILKNDYEGVKIGVWIVKNSADTIAYSGTGLGSATVPTTATAQIAPFSSIEQIKDPFGDGISINNSNSRNLMLPPGKYWLDWRVGCFSGNSAYNYRLYFDASIAGYVPSLSRTHWIARGAHNYLQEHTGRFEARNASGYYESVDSTCYINVLHSHWWQNWPPGGTPTINKADSTNAFGNNTDYPYGASRLLVMRLE